MESTSFKSEEYKQGVIVLIEEASDRFLFQLTVKSALGIVSVMNGEWKPEYAKDGELNIVWGMPETSLENVLNSRDFKMISSRAINYVNQQCRNHLVT